MSVDRFLVLVSHVRTCAERLERLGVNQSAVSPVHGELLREADYRPRP
jgi:hypothetical protein